mgnify:CR=1 FL=1
MTVDPIALSFHPDASHKEVTFSFVLSRPVNDLRFRFHGYATTSYFGNTGPLDAGFHTVVWDGTFNDPEFDIPDGVYAVYPQYQLEPGDTYRNMLNTGDQTSPALAYLAIDREAPKICDVAVEVADIANHLRVTGYIDDLSRDVLRDVPVVYLDGEQLETTNRADLSGPGRGYDFTCFDALVPVELDGSTISFTLEAKDRAGNSSVQEIELLPFELDNPAVDLIDSDVHTVSGRAIPGMEVTVGGQVVEVDSEGYFVAEVAVPAAVSFIDVVADVPGWDNFTPFKQQIQVIRSGSIAAKVKFTPRTFNLKSQGQWVSVDAIAPTGSSFTVDDADNVQLLVNGQSVAAAECKVQGDKLMAKFVAASVAELFAEPGQHTVILTGTVDGALFFGYDSVRVISPGK